MLTGIFSTLLIPETKQKTLEELSNEKQEGFIQGPAEPRVQWVHPCKCTLVAHESCLLNWGSSAQQDAARAKNALKCPQCGAQYEIESDRTDHVAAHKGSALRKVES